MTSPTPSYMGIDSGLRRVSVAVVCGEKFSVSTRKTPQPSEIGRDIPFAETLDTLSRATTSAIRDAISPFDNGDPACHGIAKCVIERPAGKKVQREIIAAEAIIVQCAAGWIDYPAIVEMMPATWKMHGLHRGQASKPYILQWARRRGYMGEIQDEADALGMAVAARVVAEMPMQDELTAVQ